MEKMLKIFFLFYIIRAIYSDSEEINEKYIDLLPEAEKQEFLNRIARRILEGIQSDDTPNDSHVDITDDQLDQHHAYVQDIIKQESENLKTNENDDLGRANDNNYVDINSKGGKREKRKNDENIKVETTPEPVYNVIPVKAIYEDYDTISKSNIHNTSVRNNDHENIKTEQEIKFDNNNNEHNEESHTVKSTNVESLNINSSNINDDDDSNNIKTTDAIEFELNSNDNTTSDNADYEISTVVNVKNDTFNDETKVYEVSTQTINQSIDKEDSNTDDLNNMTLTTDKSKNLDMPEETSQTNILTEDDTTSLPIDMTMMSNNNRRGMDLDDTFNLTKVDEFLQTSTSIPISNKHSNVIETTETNLREIRDSSNISTAKSNILQYFSGENSNNSYEVKPKLIEGTTLSEDDSEIPSINVVMSPKKEYKVYEVAPGNTPFIMSKNFTEHNPEEPNQHNYVPVYNFAPENAYFKPNVRYRPNGENDDHAQTQEQNEPNVVPANRLFGYNKKYSIPSNGKYRPFEQLYQIPYYNIMKPNKVKTTSIYYDPYDNLDMEYDIGRFKSAKLRNVRTGFDRFPNSDEEDHPMNSIHKSNSVKDHIRAVRNLMYLQNIFGPLSEIQRKFAPSPKQSNVKVLPVNLKHFKFPNNIAIDYYYERMQSDEDYLDMVNLGQRTKPTTVRENNKKTDANIKIDDHLYYKDDNNKKKFKKFFNSMVTVLKDIIRFDNDALVQYEWLTTAVQLQMTIRTLLGILNKLKQGEHLDKNHLELLKYGLYLYKIAKTEVDLNKEVEDSTKEDGKPFMSEEERSVLPHNKRRKKIRRPIQLWKDYVHYLRNVDKLKIFHRLSIFNEFEDFLENLLRYLYNLHEAIKNLSTVTTYKKQNWFVDLKRIYLNKASRKDIGEVILHLSLIHLLYTLEDSRRKVGEDYKKFIKNNKNEVERAKENFVFVLLVLEELSKM